MNDFARYLISSAIAGAIIAALAFLSDDSTMIGAIVEILAVPGYLPASVIFPQGFHSGSPKAFITLIFVFDGLIYGLPAFLFWRRRRRRKL